MKKIPLYLLLVILICTPVFAQGLYTYSKTPGESVTFAWDAIPVNITCGTQTVILTKGQATYTCSGRTYPLVWSGDDVRIVGAKEGGGDIIIAFRYGFQAIKSGVTPESVLATGETKAIQIAIPLSFGEGVFKLKVRAVRTWNGIDAASDYAYSDGPNGVVNGVARPWVIEVKAVPPPTCTSFTYSEWTPASCPANGVQTRTVLTSIPTGCVGGTPVLSQTCIIPPSLDSIKGLKVVP
jgi:hypothetical protein